MKLEEFLKTNNYTQKSFIQDFEKETGTKIPQSTLAKWILQTRLPRKKQMVLLYDFTGGRVSPNDFYLN